MMGKTPMKFKHIIVTVNRILSEKFDEDNIWPYPAPGWVSEDLPGLAIVIVPDIDTLIENELNGMYSITHVESGWRLPGLIFDHLCIAVRCMGFIKKLSDEDGIRWDRQKDEVVKDKRNQQIAIRAYHERDCWDKYWFKELEDGDDGDD